MPKLKKRRQRKKIKPTPKIKRTSRKIKRNIKRPGNHKFLKLFFKTIFFLFLIFIFTYIFKNKLFRIKTINCYIEDKDCSSENIQIDSKFYQYSLFSLPKNSVKNHILNQYSQVESVTIKKKLPNTINLYLKNRQTFAQVKDSDDTYFFIDRQGKIIKRAYNSQLVTISTDHSFEVGTFITGPTLLSAIEILSLLQNSFTPVNTIEVENEQSLKIIISSGQVAFLNPSKDFAKQVDSLQFILQNSTIEKDQKIISIDLRYDSPVVKTKSN